MMIQDFYTEFDNLSGPRKHEGLKKIFETLLFNMGNHEDLINDILEECSRYESYDEFGTEGLDI